MAFSLTGWDTLEAPRAPAQYSGSSAAFFTRTRAAGFMRARQTDPLDAVKPSTSEQRGQVLGGFIEGSPAPSRGKACAQPARGPSIVPSPLTEHQRTEDGGCVQTDAGAQLTPCMTHRLSCGSWVTFKTGLNRFLLTSVITHM